MTAIDVSGAAGSAHSDEELVRKIVDGESALFEVVVRRHNQRIYRAVRGILHTEDEIEDVMQQAYLNAWEHLHQFAGNSRFSTWLTRIAVNEALARLRKRGRFINDDDEVIMTLAADESADPEHTASAAEMRDVLQHEIDTLPRPFRSVLMLRDVEGMSTAEAAEALGISEDLVKTRLHRAHAKLRDNLYRRAGMSLEALFTFGNARCDRVTAAVMSEIARRG